MYNWFLAASQSEVGETVRKSGHEREILRYSLRPSDGRTIVVLHSIFSRFSPLSGSFIAATQQAEHMSGGC